jgi:hypothetical protein
MTAYKQLMKNLFATADLGAGLAAAIPGLRLYKWSQQWMVPTCLRERF